MTEIFPPQPPEKLPSDNLVADTAVSGMGRVLNRLRRKQQPEAGFSHLLEEAHPQELPAIYEFKESEPVVPQPLPKLVDIDFSGRDIEVSNIKGERFTEEEYVNGLKSVLADNPDFLNKIQWMGEVELVDALTAQAGWLINNAVRGEKTIVVNEASHRKGLKSGGYFTRLLTGLAKNHLTSLGQPQLADNIVEDEALTEGTDYSEYKAVIFDDWVGSGHDMGQRVNWSFRRLEKFGVRKENTTINLLASHEDHLKHGFDDGAFYRETGYALPIIAPFSVKGWNKSQGGYSPFSGIHSSMDYAFTLMEEMVDATQTTNKLHISDNPFSLDSRDTLGKPEFYERIEEGVRTKLTRASSN